MRGNRYGTSAAAKSGGSIPACAGEPVVTPNSPAPWPVYPRVCGGTCADLAEPQPAHGLSPRVRGNHGLPDSQPQHFGSIPACAGEPFPGVVHRPNRRVYPRVCGGTRQPLAIPGALAGLSPRVRGNLQQTLRAVCPPGSIPACAGEPPSSSHVRGTLTVYPRVCGGTVDSHNAHYVTSGLSPRVRGNPGG